MRSTGTLRFWQLYRALPPNIRDLAVKNYRLWQRDPNHPSLHFRRLQGGSDRFTIRVGDHYRALGTQKGDAIVWVWIGTHVEYDRLTGS